MRIFLGERVQSWECFERDIWFWNLDYLSILRIFQKNRTYEIVKILYIIDRGQILKIFDFVFLFHFIEIFLLHYNYLKNYI